MQQSDNNNKNINYKSKAVSLLKLIWSDIWGLLLLIVAIVILKSIFKDETHISGFITGVVCGAMVWLIMYRKKNWLYPIAYMIIIFAYLITKRAVDVGIAGFYLNDWFSSTELMLMISTIVAVLLFILTKNINRISNSSILYRALAVLLTISLVFFIGSNSSKKRDKQQIFSKASVMMIQQFFNMRNDIDSILQSDEELDMDVIKDELDFNFQNVPVLIQSFYPEESEASKFNSFIKDNLKDYLFNYEEGVNENKYPTGISDKERLSDVSSFCSGMAGDFNAANGDLNKIEDVLSNLGTKFDTIVN